MKTASVRNAKLDPDPATIATLIATGVSLLLSLDQSKKAQQQRKDTEETRRIFESLSEIKQAVNSLRSLWEFFSKIGDTHSSGRVLVFGNSKKFFKEEEYAEFVERCDGAINSIGVINKAVYQINISNLFLDEKNANDLRYLFKVLEDYCNKIVFSRADYETVFFDLLPALLEHTDRVIEKLSAIVGQK